MVIKQDVRKTFYRVD